jgi:chromosome segregation ATPase
METYTDTLPPFWWLTPWRHVRRLHAATLALNDALHQMEGDGERWHEQAVAAEYEVARLNDELSLANAKVDELTTALQRHAKPANVEKLKADLADERQAVRNLRKHLHDANRHLRKEQVQTHKLEQEARKKLDEVHTLREALKEKAELVWKAAAVIRHHGLDKPGKLLFEDKVGGNSIHAPKPKAKKKGGAK